MEKGQGSLEYLLILAAILAIAVVVVVVANSMLQAPQSQSKLQQDKYACSLQGIELVGYTEIGTVSTLNYGGNPCEKKTNSIGGVVASCQLGDGSTVYVNTTASGCSFNVTSSSP